MRIESIYLRDVGPFDEATIGFPEGKNPDLADVYLLTGPNGCGKSTVLYAIAAMIAAGYYGLGGDLLHPRFRSPRSFAAISGSGVNRIAAWMNVANSRWMHEELTPLHISSSAMHMAGSSNNLGYFAEPASLSYQHLISSSNSPASKPFEWAAFAYSGIRSVEDAHVEAIKDPSTSPFDNSLDFNSSTDSKLLVHWIANQHFRRLKAKELGRSERAESIARSLRDIERVVSEIIGESFSFAINDEDNDVRIQRDGVVTTMGVLPAGLQSIMSWIADLLMRLDRIPWVDNIPPMQRSFLLLLDEVDIHLHPAWQRKIIPVVQKIFPKAQIIASTHSPFVVASAEDAHVITFSVKDGKSELAGILDSQKGSSYGAVLREIFGIDSEFDVRTEEMFAEFHAAKSKLLRGEVSDRVEVDRLASELAQRSEEIQQLIGFELRQLDRQLAQRTSGK